MKPVYCGNLDLDADDSEVERLFSRYGKVEKVKMKTGFAFIYMDDERDAEDAIRGLDRLEFGRRGLKLQVEWSKQDNNSRPSGNTRPTNTLFVVNFDTVNTKKQDLERHFGPYGKIVDIRMRSEFAFIQFESQHDAIDALEATNMSKLLDCFIKVEYAACDAQGKRNVYSPDRRSRERTPPRVYSSGRSQQPSRANLRPSDTLFVANIDPDNTRISDLENHFEPYGKVLSIRIKKNFAFVKFEHPEDATRALEATDSSELLDCVIKVEYAAGYNQETKREYSPDRRGWDRSPPRSYSSGQSQHGSRSSSSRKPTKTLFVANIDPTNTRMRDLEMHFEPYGDLLDVRIKKNFGFVKFAYQEDATKALRAANLSMLKGRTISVEYVVSDDADPRNGHSLDRMSNDRSTSRDHGRSAASSRSSRPSKTLFVVNFDPLSTRKLDLEKHFEPYGKILDVRVRTKYAFVEFEYQADATKALESTDMSTLLDQVISVQYAASNEERRNGNISDRITRDGSPEDGRLSESPRGIKRGSPDYSRNPSPYRKIQRRDSPSPDRAESPVDYSDSPRPEDHEM